MILRLRQQFGTRRSRASYINQGERGIKDAGWTVSVACRDLYLWLRDAFLMSNVSAEMSKFGKALKHRRLPTRGYIWFDLILTLRHAVCAQLSCSSDRSPSVALARGLWEPSPRGAGRPWLAPDSGATWKHISPLSASTRSRAICSLRSPRYPHKERLRRSRSLPCNATRVAIDHICAASASRCASPFRRCHRVRCLYTALGERGSPMRVTNQGHASRR